MSKTIITERIRINNILNSKYEYRNSKQIQMTKTFRISKIRISKIVSDFVLRVSYFYTLI